MATIANLVAKLGLDTSGFEQVSKSFAAKTQAIYSQIAAAHGQVTAASEEAKGKTVTAFKAVDSQAKSYLATLLGIGSATVVAGTSIQAAFNVDRAQQHISRQSGKSVDPSNLAGAYDRVARAVTLAQQAFGSAFSKAAGLAGVMDTITNITKNLTGIFQKLGTVTGWVVGFFSTSTPLGMAFVLAIKALGVAFSFAFGFLIEHAIHHVLELIVYKLTGMTIWSAACAAAHWLLHGAVAALNAISSTLLKWIVSWIANLRFGGLATKIMAAAQWIWTTAIAATNAVLKIMNTLLLLSWASIGLLVGVIAIAAAAVYGLAKAWDWFTASSADSGEQTAKEMLATAKIIEDAQAELAQVGMTESEKRIDSLRREKGVVSDLEKMAIRQSVAMKAQSEIEDNLLKAQQARKRVGMTDPQKAASKLADEKGVTNWNLSDKLNQTAVLNESTNLAQKELELRSKLATVGASSAEKEIAALRMKMNINGSDISQQVTKNDLMSKELAIATAINNASQAANKAASRGVRNDIQKQADALKDAAGGRALSESEEDALLQIASTNQLTEAKNALAAATQELNAVGLAGSEKTIDAQKNSKGVMTEATEQIIRQTEAVKALTNVKEELAAAEKASQQLGMTKAQKQADDAARAGMDAAQQEELAYGNQRVTQLEEENRLRQEIIDKQKQIAQVGMTEAEKAADDNRRRAKNGGADVDVQLKENERLGKRLKTMRTIEQLVDASKETKKIDRDAKALETLKDNLNEIIEMASSGPFDPEKMTKALKGNQDIFEKELGAHGTTVNYQSPTAILRGSAEAALAENRQQNPMEKLTDVQRQQLAEAKKARQIAQAQLDQLKKTAPLALVDF